MDRIYSFLAGRFRSNSEQYSQARLIINFSLIEIGVILFYLLVHDQFHFHVPKFIYLLYLATVSASLIPFRMGMSLQSMAHITLGILWSSFVISIAYSGGIYSLILPWIALMPIMANLLISHTAARWWGVISFFSIAFFMFFFREQQLLLDPASDWRSLFSNLGLVFIVSFFAYLFSDSKTKLLDELKATNNELKEQQEEVITQYEELKQQRDELSAQRNFIERQNTLLLGQNKHIESVNDQLAKRIKEIFERNETLEAHWHTLLAISKNKEVCFGDLDVALKHICKTASQSLKVNRVSIWHHDGERKSIQCLVLFESDEDRFLVEEELLATDFPHYFEALLEEEVISADNAETDSHTYEFRDVYLRPHHILSMMDTPFFLEGKLGGVLCCEHKSHRHWLPEDIIFAQALSDIITLVLRTQQRRQYETTLRLQRREIEKINHSLEEKVKERTTQLEEQNQQLSEYAFINSHLLRGPLCRILGLINLLEHSIGTEKLIIDHLKLSSEELDQVVRQINNAIEDGTYLNREQFNNLEKKLR